MKPIGVHDLEVSVFLLRDGSFTFLGKRLILFNALVVLYGLWRITYGLSPVLVQAIAMVGLAHALFLAYLYNRRLRLRAKLSKRFTSIRAAKFGKKVFFSFQTGDGEDLCYKTSDRDSYGRALSYAMYELKQPSAIVFENFGVDHPFDLGGDSHLSGQADLEFQISEEADPEDLLRDFPDGQGSMMQRFLSDTIGQFTGYFISCAFGIQPDPLEIELSPDAKVVCTVRLMVEPSSAKSAAI